MSGADLPAHSAPLPSGVTRLDLVLGGGIPRGDLMLIIGPPGSGKTTLACQVAFHTAANQLDVVMVSTQSEPASRLAKHVRTFSFWDASAFGRRLVLSSVFPVLEQGTEALLRAIVEAVQRRKAALLVLDGLSGLRDVPSGTPEPLHFVHELAPAMATLGCTTIVTSSEVPDLRRVPPEFTACDSIVELTQVDAGANTTRALRVWKLRGGTSLLGSHTMRITGEGLTVYPRVEALPLPTDHTSACAVLSMGAAELDAMMMGGLPSGSCTLLVGAPGTGKTLLGWQFVLEGARRGERAVFVTLRDSARQLLRRASAMTPELEAALTDGRITLLNLASMPLEPDVVLAETCSALERTGATRLVIVSIAELEHALPVERKRSALGALLALLRARAVTSLMTREKHPGSDSDGCGSRSPLDVLAENVIRLRDVDYGGRRHRVVSISRMRDCAHDRSIRQYELDPAGLRVLSPAESPEGLLASIANRASEQHPRPARDGRPFSDEDWE